jgi:beta-N-acetylhexosaminidase
LIKRTRLFLFIILSALLLSACAYEGSISVATGSSQPSVSSQPAEMPSVTPAEEPSPTPAATPDPLDAYISQMSDRELIGQMVMIGFDGTKDMASGSIELMQEYSVGNILLFGWNTNTFSQTKALVDNVNSHNLSGIPLLIGIDLEGGYVTRFPKQWHPSLNSAKILGDKNDPDVVYEQYKRIGEQLKEIGININFAPVLDIAHNPSSTFLGKSRRMFGSDPEIVSILIAEAIRGLHDAGIASLGKHFPGHGETASDSHETLPVLDATLEEMESYSLIPFKAAVDAGVDAMLVAHLSYPNVDNRYITSVSPAVITGILREEMGFGGVVFSDDLRMKGFTSQYSAGGGAVLHMLAGGDVLLIGGKYTDKQKAVLDSLYAALQDGTLTRERLEQSVRRILELKIKYAGFTVDE